MYKQFGIYVGEYDVFIPTKIKKSFIKGLIFPIDNEDYRINKNNIKNETINNYLRYRLYHVNENPFLKNEVIKVNIVTENKIKTERGYLG